MRMDRLEDLPGCAQAIAESHDRRRLGLKGEMGAQGKTTLVQRCARCGE